MTGQFGFAKHPASNLPDRNNVQCTHIYNMGTHMKTTIEVSDALFNSAKQLAQKNQTTMRALIEDGLRRVLNDQPVKRRLAFKLKVESVRGASMLITDPHRWRQLEDEHVISRTIKPLK